MLRRHTAPLLALSVVLALLAACASDDGVTDGTAEEGMAEEGMADDMDGMGEGADITTGVETRVDALPDEPLGWVGYRLDSGGDESHAWGPAILYVQEGSQTLEVDGAEVTLGTDDAVFIEEGVEHTVPDGELWAFLLTDPDGDAPTGLEEASRELASGPLEGLPQGEVEVRFLIVDLPPQGGQTTVHTHPGPEYIAVVAGDIEYETDLAETTTLSVGDEAALPPDTAVQKRNPHDEPARFLSWFIVDPDEPFSPGAAFERE